MSRDVLFLSLHPRFADAVFAGEKRVELRRTRPRIEAGSRVLVYASSPVSSLVGAFVVESVLEMPPSRLWEQIGRCAGLTRTEFRRYFIGAKLGYGIVIREAHAFDQFVPLDTLRSSDRQFRPPQCYHYITPRQAEILSGCPLPAA